jgi:epoxyqueuosine reductase
MPPERRELDLRGLLLLREHEDYVHRFTRSPMKRAKAVGLRRNAAVAMGNRGDEAYVPTLGQALDDDPEPVVRRHAAWALGRLGTSEARALLTAALAREEEEGVRTEIELALDSSIG